MINRAWNLKDSKFFQGGKPLERWGVVNFAGVPDQVINGFFGTLMSQAQARGRSSLLITRFRTKANELGNLQE
jgi:hypothetical protein